MMKKLPLIAVIIVIFYSFFTLSASARGEESRIYDKAGIIDDEGRIEAALSSFEAKCGIPIRLVTTSGNGFYDLSEIGFSYGENLIVLEINYYHYTNTYYYYLDTYGDAYEKISDSEVDRILDAKNVYDNIKGGRFADGVVAFAGLTEKAYLGALQESWIETVLVSLVIASIIGGATVGIVVYKYKRKLKSPTYPLDKYARLNLLGAECSDMFIGSTVSKVRISTSSGSSGGGSRGRSGGGRRGGR